MTQDWPHHYWCPYPERDCVCPADLASPTERDGLAVGDRVTVNGYREATVDGFNTLACDVILRRDTGDRDTVCRKQAAVVRV